MRIDTWINDELITVETEDVWASTFAHWDALVPTETATAIANATVAALEGRTPKPPRKPRTPKPIVAEITNTAELSDSEVFAYYKRIGLREDVRFFLAHTVRGPWTDDAQMLLTELETRKSSMADRARYRRLTDQWRADMLRVEMASARCRHARIQRRLERARARMTIAA